MKQSHTVMIGVKLQKVMADLHCHLGIQVIGVKPFDVAGSRYNSPKLF
jgi:hypothetical protein